MPSAARAQVCDSTSGFAVLQETVVDQTTRIPLIGVSVMAVWRDQDYERRTNATTDSLGRAFFCAPPDIPVGVRISHFRQSSSDKIVLSKSRTTWHLTTLDLPGYLVRGTITDQLNGQPVGNVLLQLAPTRVRVLSDSAGKFAFVRVPIGDYQLQVQHISYARNAVPLQIREEDVNADVRLTPEAIALQPIVVTTFSRRLERTGFYERQKRGVGLFLTRRQVDSMSVQNASDLLRVVPGLRLLFQAQRRGPPLQQTIGRNNCRFKFIVDGARTLPDFEMDNIAAFAIEGVEVYSGLAEIPTAFRPLVYEPTSTPCGVIAIWTRDGK